MFSVFATTKFTSKRWLYALVLGILILLAALLFALDNLNVLHVNAQSSTTTTLPTISQNIVYLVNQGDEVTLLMNKSIFSDAHTQVSLTLKGSNTDEALTVYGIDFICFANDDKPTTHTDCLSDSNIAGYWYDLVASK